MQKLLTCFFALNICVPAAFGATGAISRAVPATDNDGIAASRATATASAVTETDTGAAPRTTVAAPSNVTASRTAVPSRAVVSSTATRDTTIQSTSVTASRAAAARGATDTGGTPHDKLSEAVHTVGRNSRVSAASINNTPAVRRAGLSLRPSTAEVGGRATIGTSGVQTGSNMNSEVRTVRTSRAASQNNVTTRESITEAKERLEQTADLNKSCQEQYNECMDQFCAVIDSNQKRCSCSSNLSRYTKVEKAVKDANTQLNDVAQRIRYVGLSADEIRAIMSATEAEEALSGARDTTETRNMLDDIEALIKDPASATAGTDSYSSLDLNLEFSSDITGLFSLDFLNTSSGSMANLRGADLYNAAKRRCNTVLTQCKNAGATQAQITANYDLAIDRDCIAYEQGLNKMNETLVSNVRSANLMLQKARMAVLQNKNQYDAKGCIAALETCMTDEMVCGDGYLKCLDPTKKYIDENGKVVLGQDVTQITKFMKNYDNSKINKMFLGDAAGTGITTQNCVEQTQADVAGTDVIKGGDGACNVRYLLQKIGTGDKVTDNGLCRAVLDKCQRYTYTSDGKYQKYNDIVVNYIQRAMVNIRAGQQKAISDYASNCMLDLATCYNQQVTQVNAWSTTASVDSIRRVMRGACRNVALTCAYAIFDNMNCPQNGTPTDCDSSCEENKDQTCLLDGVSEMFYQSLLCPDNSTYKTQKGNAGKDNYVNEYCQCNTDYEYYAGQCLQVCDNGGAGRDSYGRCKTESKD